MKISTKFFAILAISACGVLAQAQQIASLKVATGVANNTYSTMFKEINARCASDIPMTEESSTGAVESMEKLTGNTVNGAYTQVDVLFDLARTQDMSNIKTLLALHPEEVHIIARADSGLRAGGMWGTDFKSKPIVFNDLSQLAGYKVGAAGGSLTTARVIRLQSEVAYNVVPFAQNDDALAALDDNKVQAVIMVGGAPLASVSKLGPEHKLLSIPEALVGSLKNAYRPARLTYSQMGARGVPTVSTDALFVTREYTTPAIRQALAKFRSCALSKLTEIKETTGTHKKWQTVDPENHGKWPWYDLSDVNISGGTGSSVKLVPAVPQAAASAIEAMALPVTTPAKKK